MGPVYDEDGHETDYPEFAVDGADEPAPDDWVTDDHKIFREYETGKVVATARNPDTMAEDVRAAMDAARFWPSVWFISDHGNAHMIDLDDN